MKRSLTMMLVMVALAGCKTRPPCELLPQNNQTMMLMMEAGIYFTVLKDAGVLPEIGKEDHGNLQTTPVIGPSQTAVYPFSAKLGAVMDGSDTIYWYVMEKKNESADWAVAKVWKTNKKNDVLAEDLALPNSAAQAKANADLRKKMKDWRASQQPVGADGKPAAQP